MQRLYLQIYAAVVAVLLLFALLTGGAFWAFDRETGRRDWIAEVTTFAETVIPPIDAPPERLQRFVHAFADPLEMDLTVYDASGEVLARAGHRVPQPPRAGGSQWLGRRGRHGSFAIALPDGRWIVAAGNRPGRPIPHLFAGMGLLALATGIAAFPLTRRLTRRLESLKEHVEALGEGHLEERVPVEGSDEIAQLARAFNRTADRIQGLVADKTRLLADTSHELRTPLTRVRMAIALLDEAPRPDLLARIDRDIEELDALIGELLITSRLDAPEQRLVKESVDLLALAAEEAARIEGIEVHGDPRTVEGDPRLLRRLLRNLLENAVRHGEKPVEVVVESGEAPRSVRLTVSDRGPGLPESERERIFEPFYRPLGQASAEGGVGLGLALVRRIANRHGGRVFCEPRAGGGTRFVLELPGPAA
jgi:signal transduction histidine kinase